MHHYNTILGQMLKIFSRYEFQESVLETGIEYHARGFTSWNHFVAMLFGQLAGQDSLRGIGAGLATQAKTLYHLGIKPTHRSTLAYANEHRTHELFKKTFFRMLSKCQEIAPKHKFRFKNPLYPAPQKAPSVKTGMNGNGFPEGFFPKATPVKAWCGVYSIGATIIELCLSLYDWDKFCTTKGAVKLRVKLSHAGYLPAFMVVTAGNAQDVKIAPSIPLEKGDVAIFDKAYLDFAWFSSIDDKGIYFITRLKKNADYEVIKHRDASRMQYIRSDQIIKLKGVLSKQKFPRALRRVRSKDPQTGKIITILTNNFTWSAKTIGRIYKERWQIELFFKALKQQLKVKSFVGTSKNALLSQLWMALTAYLLLSYLKFKSKFGWSLHTLCSILPVNLFARRNLWDWFSAPFHEHGKAPPETLLQLQFKF